MSGNHCNKKLKTILTGVIGIPPATSSINSLNNDCLAMILVHLPIWPRLEIESGKYTIS